MIHIGWKHYKQSFGSDDNPIAEMSKQSIRAAIQMGFLTYWIGDDFAGFLIALFSLGGQKPQLACELWGLGSDSSASCSHWLCLHRSGLTSPPWGSIHMENTSWPSWKSTIWRMVLTWAPSAALQMASCKRPTPPQPGYRQQPVLPLPLPMAPRLSLMFPSDPREGFVPTVL